MRAALTLLLLAVLPAGASEIWTNIFATTGVFNNSQTVAGAYGIVNGCSSAADLALVQAGGFGDFGLAGCVTVAASSTNVGGEWGVFGSARNPDNSSNAVGIGSVAIATGDGTGSTLSQRVRIWGFNPLMTDQGHTHVLMQNEYDINITGTDTLVWGIAFDGTSTHAPAAGSFGVGLGPLGTGITWPMGFDCTTGSTTTCLNLDPAASGNSQTSQTIVFKGTNSGGTSTSVTEGSTANGGIEWVSSVSGTGGDPNFFVWGATINYLWYPDGHMVFSNGVTLANVPASVAGSIGYCTNCNPGSNPCNTSVTTGTFYIRLGSGALKCL